MKKLAYSLLAVIIAATMIFAVTGCSGGADNPAGEVKTAGNLSVFVPEKWTLIPGTAGGIEDDNSLFLKESEDSTEYLWVQIQDKDTVKSSLESSLEDDIEPITLDGVEWTGKVNMITAEKDGTVFLVAQYGYDFNDSLVQYILKSVKKA
ncbi:MAG: hypothetical protein ACI4HO_01210 [Ruminococcus sp.]